MLCLSVVGSSQLSPEKFYQSAMREINPSHVEWVRRTSVQVNNQKMEEENIRIVVNNYTAQNNMTNQMSIEALTVLVMMEASKSAQEDLKAMLANVQNINNKKEELRKAQEEMKNNKSQISSSRLDSIKVLINTAERRINLAQTKNIANAGMSQPVKKDTLKNRNVLVYNQANKIEVDNVKESLKNKLDSMSEMGQQEQLRLQMSMDRMAKTQRALTNLMKKISDTASQIISNLK